MTLNYTKSSGPVCSLFCMDIMKCASVYFCMANSELQRVTNVGFPQRKLSPNPHPHKSVNLDLQKGVGFRRIRIQNLSHPHSVGSLCSVKC